MVDDDDATRPATQPVAPDPAAVVGDEESPVPERDFGSTVVPALPAILRRVAPQEGAGGAVRLTANHNVLGRSHTCNIPLLSATASRQHAEIEARDGEWVLFPAGGKMVIVDGRPAFDEIRLRHEMRIRLGGDELVFLQEELDAGGPEQEEETHVPAPGGFAATPGAAEPGRSPVVWIAVAGTAVVMAALAFWLLL